MSQPYVGEIRCFGGNFAPEGWMTCDGQLLPISEFETLFNLIGTTYGGDGQSTFALPNLSGRVPIHQGSLNGFATVLGQPLGATNVTLTTNQIPIHNHSILSEMVAPGGAPERTATPTAIAFIGTSNPDGIYNSAPPTPLNANFSAKAIGSTGGSQPHENRQPYLAVTFIISLFGIFPSQS